MMQNITASVGGAGPWSGQHRLPNQHSTRTQVSSRLVSLVSLSWRKPHLSSTEEESGRCACMPPPLVMLHKRATRTVTLWPNDSLRSQQLLAHSIDSRAIVQTQTGKEPRKFGPFMKRD
eukprot:84123-Amphidinium_carterae.1